VLAAFDRSDTLFTMATLDLPSVRNMGVFLTTLQRLKIPADTVRLILNKAESNVGIEVDQVVKLFPQGFSSVLPYASEVSRSINLGMPVLAASPGTEVSRKLAAGMTPLLPSGIEVVPPPVESRRVRAGRLFRRSSRTYAAEVLS
jgi:pilus assembly protein CpaE